MALFGKSAARQFYDLSDVAGNSDSEILLALQRGEAACGSYLQIFRCWCPRVIMDPARTFVAGCIPAVSAACCHHDVTH